MLATPLQVKRVLDENLFLLQVLNLDFKENQNFDLDPSFNLALERSTDPLLVGLQNGCHVLSYRQPHFSFRTRQSLPRQSTMFYFEATLLDAPLPTALSFLSSAEVVVGVAEASCPADQRPGQAMRGGQSIGLSSLGGVFSQTLKLFELENFGPGDTVGVGVNMTRRELFFTKNGVFSASVVRLTHIMDFYPTVSLTSGSPRVRLNFGKTPFYFDFERYVQVELASLLQAIEQQPITKGCVAKLVLDYTRHHGYRKTSEQLEHSLALHGSQEVQSLPIKQNKLQAPKVHRPLTRRSHDGLELRERNTKARLDFRLVPSSSLRLQPSASMKKPRKTLDTSISQQDPSCATQRGLIRSLITSEKLAEAEKLVEVCFPGLLAEPFLRVQFIVLRFIQACTTDPITALSIAKSHFAGPNKDQPFLFHGPGLVVMSTPVKDLMVLLGGRQMAKDHFALIFDRCQADLTFDILNQAMLDRLGLPNRSGLEQTLAHFQMLSSACTVVEKGFQGVLPTRIY